MGKKPQQVSIWRRALAMAKRNPWPTIATCFTIFIGMPSAFATYNVVIEPAIPTWRSWVRDYVKEIVGPIVLAQNMQAVATDRQTLFQLEEYLDRAKKDPGAAASPIVQQRINGLESQVKTTRQRICKATGDECQ